MLHQASKVLLFIFYHTYIFIMFYDFKVDIDESCHVLKKLGSLRKIR